MKLLSLLLCILLLCILLLCSCEKSYEGPDMVHITVTGKPKPGVVNGSAGYYWELTVSIDQVLPVDIQITYTIDDTNGLKNYTIDNHIISKGNKTNIFTTQLYTTSSSTLVNPKLIKVVGTSAYTFVLTH